MNPPVTHPDRRCAGVDPTKFAMDSEHPFSGGHAWTVAMAYCAVCPFQAPCRRWAQDAGARNLIAGAALFDASGHAWSLLDRPVVAA